MTVAEISKEITVYNRNIAVNKLDRYTLLFELKCKSRFKSYRISPVENYLQFTSNSIVLDALY